MSTPFKPKEHYPGFDQDLDFDGVALKGVADPTDDQDVATKAHVAALLAAAAVEQHPTFAIKATDVDPLLQKATVTLTANEIKALNASPKTLIAAPGAGETIIVERVLFRFLWGTTQYTGGSNLSVIYEGGSTNQLAGTLAASFITGPTGAVTSDAILAALGTQLAAPQETAIQLKAAAAEFATGDSTLEVQAWFRVGAATA